MDGWGIAEDPAVSAIDAAKTPFFDAAMKKYPSAKLRASEEWVGLPMGQMGNSEVGHMNIGAGRVVYQELVRITKAMEGSEFRNRPAFLQLLDYCRSKKKPLHLLGLVSDGGVHSHIRHLKAICSEIKSAGLNNFFIHVFTDGRDTDPKSGLGFADDLEVHLSKIGSGKIASIIGRYFAMDRDNRWGRIRKAYDLLTKGLGSRYSSASNAVNSAYSAGQTDEFIEPGVIESGGNPVAIIQPGDAVFFFNFRTDRGRQLTQALTQEHIHEFNLSPLPLHFVTMTSYDDHFRNVNVIFENEEIRMGLGEYLSMNSKKQIRIAETEKYPHVTFFFNGGREDKINGETYILCPSPKVATYDLQPEMSAFDIRDKILPELKKAEADFICLNFANPDMVGHTGVFEAAVRACEVVDECVAAVVNAALENGYNVLVTADHGNADKMRNPDGSPHTAHTTALVPLYLAQKEITHSLRDGKLGDLAPTILTLMGLPVPKEMTGEVLVRTKGE